MLFFTTYCVYFITDERHSHVIHMCIIFPSCLLYIGCLMHWGFALYVVIVSMRNARLLWDAIQQLITVSLIGMQIHPCLSYDRVTYTCANWYCTKQLHVQCGWSCKLIGWHSYETHVLCTHVHNNVVTCSWKAFMAFSFLMQASINSSAAVYSVASPSCGKKCGVYKLL